MFSPGTGKESTTTTNKKADIIMIWEQEFYSYSYTKKFRYLGSKIVPKRVYLVVLAVSKNALSGKNIIKKYIFFNLKNK